MICDDDDDYGWRNVAVSDSVVRNLWTKKKERNENKKLDIFGFTKSNMNEMGYNVRKKSKFECTNNLSNWIRLQWWMKQIFLYQKKNIDISTVYHHHPESKINNFVDSKSEKNVEKKTRFTKKKKNLLSETFSIRKKIKCNNNTKKKIFRVNRVFVVWNKFSNQNSSKSERERNGKKNWNVSTNIDFIKSYIFIIL